MFPRLCICSKDQNMVVLDIEKVYLTSLNE